MGYFNLSYKNLFLFIAGLLSVPFHYLDAQVRERISYDSKDYPYEFAIIKSQQEYSIFLDLNGDGIDEQLVIQSGVSGGVSPLITAMRYGGETIEQKNFPRARKIAFNFAYDIDHDGNKELFVSEYDRDTIFADVVNIFQASLLKRIPLYINPNPHTELTDDIGVKLIDVIPTLMSNDALLIVLHIASFSRQPRDVSAYSLATGKCVWQFPMGAYPHTAIIKNILGTQFPEIYISSLASENGSNINGTNDSSSYVFGFSINGSSLWKHPMRCGSQFTTTEIGTIDWNNSGRAELILFLRGGTNSADTSYITKIDVKNGNQIGSQKQFEDHLVQFDGDLPIFDHGGRKNLVAWLRNGKALLLDSTLNVVSEKSFDFQADVDEFRIIDSPIDSSHLIVVRTNTGKTIFFNANLEPLAVVDGMFSGLRRGSNNEVQLVIQSDGQTIIGDLTKRPNSSTQWIELIVLVTFTVVFIYIVYSFFFYLQLYKTVTQRDDSVAALVLNRRGLTLRANRTFDELFKHPRKDYRREPYMELFGENLQRPIADFLDQALHNVKHLEKRIDIGSDHNVMNVLVRSFPITFGKIRLGTLVAFTNITDTLRTDRMINWALVAHNLAHEMKTPLSTIWFTLERIKQTSSENGGHVDDKYLESVGEELRRLDGYVKGFMKLANLNPPNMQVCNFNNTLNDFLDAYKTKLPETISIQRDFQNDLPGIKLDVNLFTVALTNLLDNAVIAMQGKGTLKLSTFLVRGLNTTHVCLTVSDTGCGIAPEDIPKIFNPYFSTSGGGTGLGLVITKKIIEDHAGTINFTTRRGFGTEFSIEFPAETIAAGDNNV